MLIQFLNTKYTLDTFFIFIYFFNLYKYFFLFYLLLSVKFLFTITIINYIINKMSKRSASTKQKRSNKNLMSVDFNNKKERIDR